MHRGEGMTYRAAPPPPVPVRAVPRRGYLGSLSLAQILVAEGVLLALAASLAAGPAVLLPAGAASAALLFAFFSRRQHRWWLEHRQVARDHRRRRAARIDARPGPVLAALRTVAPGLTVQDVTASDGTVGVARDEAGWFSVVMLDPAAAPLPLDALLGILAGTGQPGLVLELVTHTVPAPSPDVPAASPSGASYRQLTEATGAGPVPSYRESSVSIRVDAQALAEALLDHTADPEAAATLVAGLARKMVTSLRRLGVTGRALDTERLLALLARSCDVEPWALADGPGVDEAWTHWRSARLVHRTYWLHTWPASATEIGSLFAWASTAPAAQTSVALVLGASAPHTGADDVPVRAFIRLATRPDADLRALDRVLVEGVRRAGGELQPLDGEQGPAAYATAPTGGGAG
ncbi:type VII secretion protein EccE [Actinoplanes xinjiangensis]|uniref:Type VII secretion protein EccE n=2 Tax=Actinoplanes xinjiangensis TaxID=512350 RepID=A0A316FMW6_9ACTN|nr:type VII secretion protein EccE [Actinoplanes xinjiangensis]